MAKRPATLDDVFRALANPTRRAILVKLGRGGAQTMELANGFEMTLPSFQQHLAILEQSGLVRSMKFGRARGYRLVPKQFRTAETWLLKQRKAWDNRFVGKVRYAPPIGEA